MKKKLLVIGASGLAGYKTALLAKSDFEVYGTYNVREMKLDEGESLQLDITKGDDVKKVFSEIKPDLVINTSALHNVDYCEDHKEQAFDVNSKAVKTLYENCEKNGSKLVHISTDYVFDGNNKVPYEETSKPIPVSVYGQSKLEGENVLKNSRHVVIRPSVVYGWTPLELAGVTSSSGKPMNFALWLLTQLNKNQPLKIVTDQFASATLGDSLAESAIKMATSNKAGVYHVAGLSCESRYDFSVKLAKKFGYDSSTISKVSSTDFKQKAKRPAYSCLSSQKAINDFGLKLLSTDESLDIMRRQVEKEAPQLLGNQS